MIQSPHGHKRWTPEEDARLLRYFDDGFDPVELARLMERSVGAIYLRLETHGRIELKRQRPVPVSVEDLRRRLNAIRP